MRAEDFVGTWRGCGQDYVARDGTVSRSSVVPHPTDETHPSRIVYTTHGTVIVLTTRAGRDPLGPRYAMGDVSGASTEQKAALAEGVVAYAGRYEVDGPRVLHHMDIAFLPDWVGQTNVRVYEFVGDRLILATPADAQGGVRRIHWQRVSGEAKR
jgi:hypothetical protein